MTGADQLISHLRAAGIPVALASTSQDSASALERLGLAGAFDFSADAGANLPAELDPESFRSAARTLSFTPGVCLAVCQTGLEVDAALAANCWTLGLGGMDQVGQAHAVAPDLAALDWPGLRQLVDQGGWTIRRVTQAKPDHHLETLFTTGNGHIAVRGSALEKQPGERAASFMHALWDDMPVTRTELANLPRWWGMDVWVNGVRQNTNHGLTTWELDLRTGILTRSFTWTPEPNTELKWTDQRCLSLADPHAAAVRLTLEVTRGQAEVKLRSGLDVHVDNLALRHWELVEQSASPPLVGLLARTMATQIDLGIAATLLLDGAPCQTSQSCGADGQPAVLVTAQVGTGGKLTATKLVGLAAATDIANPLEHATKLATGLAEAGWEELVRANAQAWQDTWERCDVVIDGDPAAQVALRYNLFQLIIAAPRLADASIGAKTLSGYGYRHHIFWDTEIFMLPPFTFTQPELARRMLSYRFNRLAGARRNAIDTGARGARFPWESAGTGDEVCPTWLEHPTDPSQLVRIWTGEREIHINVDLAHACYQYWQVTGDDTFMRQQGAEVILDSATYYASAAQLEADGYYHFRQVVGPDEYHELIDNNAFTNLMVVWHLRLAKRVLAWLDNNYPADAARVRRAAGIDQQCEGLWQQVADAVVPAFWRDGVLEQFEGFFDLTDVNFEVARDPGRTASMQLIHGIEGTKTTQNIKQPDVLMLAYLQPELFTAEQLLANYRYYDPRTDHEMGSSLGPAVSAIMASRAGDPDQAYRHFMRAARADLYDVRGNADDGIHGASAGGLWQAVVFGFAGLDLNQDGWTTHPNLPAGWTRLAFNFSWQGERQTVVIEGS